MRKASITSLLSSAIIVRRTFYCTGCQSTSGIIIKVLVFLNIVVNAEQAMLEANKKGVLVITTQRVGDIVRVSFTDDGPGISRENINKLFTPFFTTKDVGEGTGLGLSICHGIITEHGGKIWVDSIYGKGATFIIELPIAEPVLVPG